ncbi:MAG: sugar nucleotide-binding protein [Halieaceae bacterium]|nr:sugar nucleotide-binding protein [Halieaceae bacterium]
MRVLIVGSDNALGQELHSILLHQGRLDVVALASPDCRWKSERQVKKALRRADCELLVDTRILASADGSEQLHDLDIDRTNWLARICQRDGIGYIYLSSARLFSGSVERQYTEDDYPDSEDTLGELLLWCEGAVRDSCERHLLLRLGPVLSHRGENAFTRMLNQIMQGGTLSLDSQQRGCPVAASDAARIVAGLLDQLSAGAEVWGIYHYGSSDVTNCFEFAEVLLATASGYAQCNADQVELTRVMGGGNPVNRILDCTKISNTFAIKQVSWRNAIAGNIKQYFEPV